MDQSTLQRKIWAPILQCYNLYSRFQFPDLDYSSLPIVDYNGNVKWSNPGLIRIYHNFNITAFPHDLNFIQLNLQPSVLYHTQYNIKTTESSPFSLANDFQHHSTWHIYNLTQQEYALINDQKESSGINFSFFFNREQNLIEKIIIVPCLLLQFITLFVFCIQQEAPLRVIFITTIEMKFVMFLHMAVNFLPFSEQDNYLEQLFYNRFLFISQLLSFIVITQAYYHNYKEIHSTLPDDITDIKLLQMKIYILEDQIHKKKIKQNKQIDIQDDNCESYFFIQYENLDDGLNKIDKQMQQAIKKPFYLKYQILDPVNLDILGFLMFIIYGISWVWKIYYSQIVDSEDQAQQIHRL